MTRKTIRTERKRTITSVLGAKQNKNKKDKSDTHTDTKRHTHTPKTQTPNPKKNASTTWSHKKGKMFHTHASWPRPDAVLMLKRRRASLTRPVSVSPPKNHPFPLPHASAALYKVTSR